MKIVFNNEKYFFDKQINFISENLIQLKILEENFSGFKIYTDHNDLLGDYSDFTTLYKQEKDGYILSNNGSVYVESEIPEPIIYPLQPTEQELINAQLMREIAMLKAGAK